MKNTMNVVKIPFQVIVALGLLAILIIEIIRPYTNIPEAPFGPVETAGSVYQVWNNFAAQFAYFTTWTNIIIVLTILASWVFRIKIKAYLKNAVATYSMIMLLVFFTIIAPYTNWSRNWWLTTMLIWQHLGIVAISLLWFFTTKTKQKTKLGQSTIITLTVPIIYIIFTTIIYIVLNVAPYNFLNFKNAFNAGFSLPISITLSVVVIIVIGLLTFGFNWLFVIANNNKKTMNVALKKNKKTSHKKVHGIKHLKTKREEKRKVKREEKRKVKSEKIKLTKAKDKKQEQTIEISVEKLFVVQTEPEEIKLKRKNKSVKKHLPKKRIANSKNNKKKNK